MHEQSIAQSIISAAKEQGEVQGITVECGDLGHLPAEEMREVLQKMTDWNITIVNKKAVVLCEECSYSGEPKIVQQLHDHNIFECPKCGTMFPKVLEGDQIILKEVVINEQ